MKIKGIALVFVLFILITGCDNKRLPVEGGADPQGHTSPTQLTARANAALLESLPFHDRQDFEDAARGLIARHPDLRVKDSAGSLIWNQPAYEFIQGEAPPSVNPSLWRQAMLNNMHGLYKVADGVYQVRGHDFANMSLIEGRTGWIVVDPLTAKETAAEAMALVREHLGDKPIRAVIYTHSHIDHFGGVAGILTPETAAAEGVRIIAPSGFMAEVTSENIIAGIAMGRRSMYQYGKNLARSLRGHVGSGLGKGPAYGTFTIIEPTELVDRTGQEKEIDGVRLVFQYTPESEAPAELTFYLPDLKAFCGAEVVSCNMHNLYTLRGTKVRNAIRWSGYIDEMIEIFGDAEVYFGSHHWPKWGNQRIIRFFKTQRDTYKYIHDQTVRLFNAGYTPNEISEVLELPASLRTAFNNRGYYGTLKHNAKAVYQLYLGWYDGNPANLDPLPPQAAGRLYVEAMGGADELLAKAGAFFEKGEYRFTAQLLNHLVFAQPDNREAKGLLARTYDQLGYRSESGPWRDVYLSGAYELRHGVPKTGLNLSSIKEILKQTPIPLFFDSMAVRLNGPEAEGKAYSINLIFTDRGDAYNLKLENAVLHHKRLTDDQAHATVKLTHDLFIGLVIGEAGLKETVFSDDLEVEGSKLDLIRFLMLFDNANDIKKTNFNIVTP